MVKTATSVMHHSTSALQSGRILDHYIDFGGSGPLLHLATANGFPPETYRPFVTPLTAYQHVVGYKCRPLWPSSHPTDMTSWHDLGHDVLHDLAELVGGQSVVGIGHSLGAIITLYAALRQPERFAALILIDPVLLPRHLLPIVWIMRQLGLSQHTRLVQSALRRRAHFPNIDSVRERYQGRGIFAEWDSLAFENYIAGGFRSTPDGGITLAWPTAWEAHIFALAPTDTWAAITRVSQPLLLIRGTSSDLIIDRSWAHLRRRLPQATLVEIDGGHMVPMQNPLVVAKVVQTFLDSL